MMSISSQISSFISASGKQTIEFLIAPGKQAFKNVHLAWTSESKGFRALMERIRRIVLAILEFFPVPLVNHLFFAVDVLCFADKKNRALAPNTSSKNTPSQNARSLETSTPTPPASTPSESTPSQSTHSLETPTPTPPASLQTSTTASVAVLPPTSTSSRASLAAVAATATTVVAAALFGLIKYLHSTPYTVPTKIASSGTPSASFSDSDKVGSAPTFIGGSQTSLPSSLTEIASSDTPSADFSDSDKVGSARTFIGGSQTSLPSSLTEIASSGTPSASFSDSDKVGSAPTFIGDSQTSFSSSLTEIESSGTPSTSFSDSVTTQFSFLKNPFGIESSLLTSPYFLLGLGVATVVGFGIYSLCTKSKSEQAKLPAPTPTPNPDPLKSPATNNKGLSLNQATADPKTTATLPTPLIPPSLPNSSETLPSPAAQDQGKSTPPTATPLPPQSQEKPVTKQPQASASTVSLMGNTKPNAPISKPLLPATSTPFTISTKQQTTTSPIPVSSAGPLSPTPLTPPSPPSARQIGNSTQNQGRSAPAAKSLLPQNQTKPDQAKPSSKPGAQQPEADDDLDDDLGFEESDDDHIVHDDNSDDGSGELEETDTTTAIIAIPVANLTKDEDYEKIANAIKDGSILNNYRSIFKACTTSSDLTIATTEIDKYTTNLKKLAENNVHANCELAAIHELCVTSSDEKEEQAENVVLAQTENFVYATDTLKCYEKAKKLLEALPSDKKISSLLSVIADKKSELLEIIKNNSNSKHQRQDSDSPRSFKPPSLPQPPQQQSSTQKKQLLRLPPKPKSSSSLATTNNSADPRLAQLLADRKAKE